MSYEKIGIIGYGYVGEAIAQSIILPLQLVIIDPAKGYKTRNKNKKSSELIISRRIK